MPDAQEASGITEDPVLSQRRGIFATWRTAERQLRGCVGFPQTEELLAVTVPRAAIEAAVADPRFLPVTVEELPALQLELSLLSPPALVQDPMAIQSGRDGLIIEVEGRRGLLLPQVAAEYRWDREQLLAQTCLKAGADPQAWRQGATLWTFTAEVFGE